MMSLYNRSDLEQLRLAVTDARSKKSTQKNQALLPTEDELSKLSYNLGLAVSEVFHFLACFLNSYVYGIVVQMLHVYVVIIFL